VKHLYRQPIARAIAVVYGLYLAYYLGWRATATLNPDALGFSLLLLLVESTSLLSFALFALMTWDTQRQAPSRFRPDYRVDVYVPTYNEDVSILEATLVGCNAITYPHTTYVLDDGRRPEVEHLAQGLRCRYLTRADNAHAKAGNLNAALPRTSGELIVVLDADTVPQPDFLDRSATSATTVWRSSSCRKSSTTSTRCSTSAGAIWRCRGTNRSCSIGLSSPARTAGMRPSGAAARQ
jgi:cellulose synthase (UDP-forming)